MQRRLPTVELAVKRFNTEKLLPTGGSDEKGKGETFQVKKRSRWAVSSWRRRSQRPKGEKAQEVYRKKP
jgi:hypothetical protein